MKRRVKRILFILITVFIVFWCAIYSTEGFKRNRFTKKIYKPQNVYEEIWNLLVIENHSSEKTVLTNVPKDAEEDWDHGFDFVGVHIPNNHGYYVTISWNRRDNNEMSFIIYSMNPEERGHILFIYNYKTKTLYGEEEFSYFLYHFLNDYFDWCEISSDFDSKYSTESLGNFTFEYVKPLYYSGR